MRAWDPERPVVVAPAMNTFMWEHPLTAVQLTKLKQYYKKLVIIEPAVKTLACGDTGKGALAPIPEICAVIKALEIEASRTRASQ
jgi:phosphopantothenoylcysteine decarboxylase